MANRPGLIVSDEEYNKFMDEAVKKHRNFSPEMAPTFQKFLERPENFMEKRWTPLPRHSHRFKPDALWPDEARMQNSEEANHGTTGQSGNESKASQESTRPMGTTERLLTFHGIPITRKNSRVRRCGGIRAVRKLTQRRVTK